MYDRPLASEAISLFVIVVEEGSFSAAAHRVGRTQPAVRFLETSVVKKLVEGASAFGPGQTRLLPASFRLQTR